MSPLDGEYKFNNCIYRDKNITLSEVSVCGSCNGQKSIVTGYRCNKRKILLEDHNKIESCSLCWEGAEITDNIEKKFPLPWEK